MEDPWGSPWTTTDYSPPKIDLPAPPPNAHFSNSADHSPQHLSPARTPWDDDDAWGGWNDAGKESPRWGRSPGLRPLDGSGSGQATRLPSPSSGARDQLATLEVARVRKDERHGDSAISLTNDLRRDTSRERYLSSARLSISSRRSTEDVWRQPDAGVSSESLTVPSREPMKRPDSPDQPPPGPAIRIDTDSRSSRQSSKVQELVEMYDGIIKQSRDASPIEPPLRRPSSAASPPQHGSIDSSQGELAVGPEPLHLDLVGEPQGEPESESESEQELVVEKNPFAEHVTPEKELQDEVESSLPKSPPSAETAVRIELDKRESTSDIGSPRGGNSHGVPEKENVTSSPQTEVDDAPRPPLPKINPPDIPFSIDMSKLGKLFPTVESTFPSPEPVPDVIIDDTFAASSERKAWYLMSRFGSTRKHNLGDDENYVRISWNQSSVRDQAIRIVRRWMEEDSITGRVVLGRRTGPAGAKIFNWDSSAPPVEISELLGRKSHSRHASMNSKGTAINSPTAPAFGWSTTSPIVSPTTSFPPPPFRTSATFELSSTEKSSPTAPLVKLQPIGQPPPCSQPLASPKSPLVKPPQTTDSGDGEERSQQQQQGENGKLEGGPEKKGEVEDDDDDDWGEMVSSPAIDTNGGFPSLDEVVEGDTKVNDTDPSGFSKATSPINGFINGTSKTASAMADWAGVSRSSFDDPSTRGLLPTSLPKSSTASWMDMNRSSMDASVSKGFLPPSLSKSSTASWTGLSRSSLDGGLSEELIPNKAMSPLKEKSRPNSWAFGSVNFLNGAPKPPPISAQPVKSIHTHSRRRSLLSKPPMVLEIDSPKEQSSPLRPHHQPPPSPPHTSKDDESVANILRGLPDLSYMLR